MKFLRLRLTFTVIFLLVLCGDFCPALHAAENNPFSVIRDLTAGYAIRSRSEKNPRKPPQKPDQSPTQEFSRTQEQEQTPSPKPEQTPSPPQRPAQTPAPPKTPAKTPTPKKAAQKSSDNDSRARNIYALFTKHNPRLEPSTAKKYADIIIEAAGKFKQDPYVIAAIIVHESTVNNKAVSKGGDYGLMQVRWKIHEKAIKQRFPNVKKANDMFDARTNIFFGTEIFADCMKRSDNDVAGGLMRYSAGSTKLRDKVMATVKELRNNQTKKGK